MALSLFQSGEFTAASGVTLPYKIECDALKKEDWDVLADIVCAYVWYGDVEGVPEGGLKFAKALRRRSRIEGGPLLIVDDVYTTGGNMEKQRAGRDAIGIVAFARSWPIQSWIKPIWVLNNILSP